MQLLQDYMIKNISQRISNSTVSILKNNPELSKFHMKLKLESQRCYRVTFHGSYKGVELCSSEYGMDVLRVLKRAEAKFYKLIRKIKELKKTQIKKMKTKFQGENYDIKYKKGDRLQPTITNTDVYV